MASTNWFRGIDQGSSTPGGNQVALANHVFSNENFAGISDGSPDGPYKGTVPGGLGSGTIVVCADGITIFTAGNTYRAIGNTSKAIIDISTSGDEFLCDDGENADNVTILGNGISGDVPAISSLNYSGTLAEFNNCVLIGVCIDPNTVASKITFNNCIIINPTRKNAGAAPIQDLELNGCTVFNGAIFTTGQIDLTDCDVSNTTFDNPVNDAINCNFFGTSPTINGTDQDNIALDPLYVGDPENNLEFLIEPTSPLIGAGTNNSTIGAFRVGELIDLSAPAENNNITVGATITITGNNRIGNIKPPVEQFDQIRKSPILPTINGILDGINDIPDFILDNPILPEKYISEVLYRETIGGGDIIKKFIYGLPMYIDDSGRSTGENDFNVFDIDSDGNLFRANNIDNINLVDVAERQPNIQLIERFEFGNGIESDGVNQYLENQLQDYILPGNEFTLMFWFELGTSQANDPIFYNKKIADTSINNMINLAQTNSPPDIRLNIRDGSGTAVVTFNVPALDQPSPGDEILFGLSMVQNGSNWDYRFFWANNNDTRDPVYLESLNVSYKADNWTGFVLNRQQNSVRYADNKFCHFWFLEEGTTEDEFNKLYNATSGNYPEVIGKTPLIDCKMDVINAGAPDTTPDDSGNGNDFNLPNGGTVNPC